MVGCMRLGRGAMKSLEYVSINKLFAFTYPSVDLEEAGKRVDTNS